MSRLNFLRKDKKIETEENVTEIDTDALGWNELVKPQHVGRPEKKVTVRKSPEEIRTQNKIIGAMANEVAGRIDKNMLNQYDVKIDSDTREYVIDGLATGKFGEKQMREILNATPGPLQNINDAAKVVSTLDTKHEKRILGELGVTGFDNWESVNAGDMRVFIKKYPTPMDFQKTSDDLLETIEITNGKDKRAQYESAMKSFKYKVYGEKQKIWEQMMALEAEKDAIVDRRERERSSEWEPGSVGVRQTSRKQAKDGLVNYETIGRDLWADDSCEDKFYVDRASQFYVLCDGAGGEVNGREAAEITANHLKEYHEKYDLTPRFALARVVEEVDRKVCRETSGSTTLVVAQVIQRDGMTKLNYVSVGDSRIYIVSKNGETRQITEDEGFRNQITNWIGNKGPNVRQVVHQQGEVELKPGDRVVMCSDGITGDFEPDLMSEKELGNIVRGSHGAQDAANNLVAAARKKDDRTAIVIVPDFNRG